MRSSSTLFLAVALTSLAACGSTTTETDGGSTPDTGSASAEDTGTAVAEDTGTATSTDSGSAGEDAGPIMGDATAGQTVATRLCVTCHGANLGGGSSSGGCTSANLRVLASEGWTEETIVTTLRTGNDDEGNALCSRMPRYNVRALNDQAAHDVAAYILTLN